MRRALSAVVLLATAACAPDDLLAGVPREGCVGDAMEACLCPDGATSTRTCQADGTFAACVCADGGGPLDAAAPLDAASLDARADVVALDAPVDVTALDAPRPDVVSIDAPRPDVVVVDAPRPDVVTVDAPRPDVGVDAPGCDADLATSPLHCGACGRACASGETCAGGRCVAPMAMCPPVCATSADCAPCSRAGDPGAYCCMSSVCVYMATGVCASAPDAGSDAMSGGDALFDDAPTGGDASMRDGGAMGPG